MAFNLPKRADLTTPQRQIISLPTDRNYVIQGGPGTGKTVMAIFRAGQLPPTARVLVLVYNRPLCEFIKVGIRNSDFGNVEVNTLHSWAGDFFGRDVPRRSPEIADFDWNEIGSQLESINKKVYTHVIIDESQDCPAPLLKGLASIAENITCFIDPNQKIVSEDNSDLMKTLSTLCVAAPYPLTINFRNTKQIRDASVLFWNPSGGTPEPAQAQSTGNKPKMIRCAVKPNDYDYADQNRKMVAVIKNNLEKEIGVLVNNNSLNPIFEELNDALKSDPTVQTLKKNGTFAVQMYKTRSKNHHKIDFTIPGVKILSHGTMKGLEFDLLLLPGLNYANNNEFDPDVCRNRLYVGLSRPLSDLFIFYFGGFGKMSKKQKPIVKPIFDHPELFDWEDDIPSTKNHNLFE